MPSSHMPIFPLGNIVFPGGLLSLRIFETRYVDMVRKCMREQSSFVVTANQQQDDTHTAAALPHNIGTRVDIIDFEQMPDGLLGITIWGQEKVDISNVQAQADTLLLADIKSSPVDTQETIPEDFIVLTKVLQKMFPEIQSHYGDNASQYLVENYQDASWVGSRLVEVLPIGVEMKIELLRMQDSGERVRVIYEALQRMQVI